MSFYESQAMGTLIDDLERSIQNTRELQVQRLLYHIIYLEGAYALVDAFLDISTKNLEMVEAYLHGDRLHS